jgi:uncharacterized membrane protein
MVYRIRRRKGNAYLTGRLSLEGHRHSNFFSSLLSMLRSQWQDLIDGAWFIPSLVALLGLLLAFLLITIDSFFDPAMLPLGFNGSATTARALLSTIVGGLLTVVGLVLSMMVVTFQLVSSQFTSRALRGLLGDRIIQITTGGILGIFANCLFILVTIRDPSGGDPDLFVPKMAVTVAIALAFVCLILLFVFVGHTTHSIQVSHMTARIAKQTLFSLHHPYPGWDNEMTDDDSMDLVRSWSAVEPSIGIYAANAGYIQTISLYYLEKVMCSAHLRVVLLVCPGDFVTPETVIAEVWPATAVEAATVEAFQSCLSIARERDMCQDPAYGVRQLADIALRALSPAINDPTTAVLCISYLATVLNCCVRQPPASSIKRMDGEDCVLVARSRPLQEYLGVLVEIGRYATDNARVAIALLDALTHVVEPIISSQRQEYLSLLESVANAIASPAIKEARTELDRTMLTEALQRTQRVIKKGLQLVS